MQEKDAQNQSNKEKFKLKKFQICDHLFRSYLDCINTFSVERKDCIQICDTLEKIDLCKITVKIDK
jgi:superfamily II RNA helicase